MQSPIELPTKRHSFQNPKPDAGVDIHDPQWIPVLNPIPTPRQYVEKELVSYSTPSQPLSSSQTAHSHTRSSVAPESVAHATEKQTTPSTEGVPDVPPLPPLPESPTKFELPSGRPASSYFQRKSVAVPKEEVKDESTDTEGTVESSADQSTIGTASLLDEQTYSIPGQPLSAKDAKDARDDVTVLPPLPLSTRSSFSSLRKSVVPSGTIVPTSKYSRKPVNGRNSTALASPRMSVSPVQNDQPARVSTVSPLQQEQTQELQTQPSPNVHSPKQSTVLTKSPLSTSRVVSNSPNLESSNSTASQKRQRALHSHPSTKSLSSRRNSSSSDVEIPAVQPSAQQPRSRPASHRARKSTDSRINRKASFTSLAPTPAPTTPLPQLPPHALSTDEDLDAESNELPRVPPEAHVHVERGPKLRIDHSQMASFMTNTQTMIFRRFDDVHVQLLLCLQDEISELERKLSEINGASMTRNDRTMECVQVIRELRRVVGEYGKIAPICDLSAY